MIFISFPFFITYKRRSLCSKRFSFRYQEDDNPTGGHPVPQKLCLHQFHTHCRKGKGERPLQIWQCNKASGMSTQSAGNTQIITLILSSRRISRLTDVTLARKSGTVMSKLKIQSDLKQDLVF